MRYCISNVISFGSTFLELVLSAAAYIESNIEIVYTEVEPKWKAYSKAIIDLAEPDTNGEPDSEEEMSSGTKRRKQRLLRTEMFLSIFNGNWKQKRIYHHCSLVCKCGGLGRRELAKKAATVFIEMVLCGRPPIPALNRWLRCESTCKWFLNLDAFNNELL